MTDTIDFILKAARKRFSDYGPCKTTMAELAKDCDMSVGNLYHHFENKNAIMMACLEQQLQEKLGAGIAAASQNQNSLDALRVFLQTRLRIGHAQFAGTRHLFDLFRAIESRHRGLLLTYEEKVIVAIADILQEGVQQGQFGCSDTMRTAYDIHQATLRYNNPINLQNNSLDLLSVDLDRLIDLLYLGLRGS